MSTSIDRGVQIVRIGVKKSIRNVNEQDFARGWRAFNLFLEEYSEARKGGREGKKKKKGKRKKKRRKKKEGEERRREEGREAEVEMARARGAQAHF